MQLLRKLIILSSFNNQAKGIIKLESVGDKVKGTINISEPKDKRLRLGIRINLEKLYEYELNNYNYEFRLDDGVNLADPVECLVIDNDALKPIMQGYVNTKYINTEKLYNLMTDKESRNLFMEDSVTVEAFKEVNDNVEDIIKEEGKKESEKEPVVPFIEEIKQEPIIQDKVEYKGKETIEPDKVNELSEEYIERIEPRKAKYENTNTVKNNKRTAAVSEENINTSKTFNNVDNNIIDPSSENVMKSNLNKAGIEEPLKEKAEPIEVKKKFEAEENEDFFEGIKPQLDELFRCYPADKELMRSVPDSKWARVNYERDEYYVVGIMYNGKRATHICYGVPGIYTLRPKQPAEWLPLDYTDPEGKGYWVVFQDAQTGKTLS